MKLVIAVVQDQDAGPLMRYLVDRGLRTTKLASTGGFLRQGNTTLLVGVEDDQVDAVAAAVRQVCQHRRAPAGGGGTEVEVGAAILFVLGVDRFERV